MNMIQNEDRIARVVNSVANCSANAFLTFRDGLVAKQYCEATLVPSPFSSISEFSNYSIFYLTI